MSIKNMWDYFIPAENNLDIKLCQSMFCMLCQSMSDILYQQKII